MTRICIIIPTYNNATTLERVLNEVLQFSTDVLVVNDGCTDGTKEILANIEGIIVLENEVNLGKGKALLLGFSKASELGYDYAITMDSDGQHYADDLPLFLNAIAEDPTKVYMGARNMDQESVPGKSSFGNKFSNFWFWAETGIKLPDTQTGFRAYPLEPISKMNLVTSKYELEIEIIVRLAWKGRGFESIPVKVLYDAEERVSHFRPFTDFFRISVLNTVLVIFTIFYHFPKRRIKKFSIKKVLNELKNELFKKGESKVSKASSIGLGLFMGIIPLWGFQIIIGLFLSTLLKLNRVLVVGVSHISIPPFIPIIIYVSYWFGAPFVENEVALEINDSLLLEDIYLHFKQYVIGSVLFAVSSGVLGGVVSFVIISLFGRKA